MKIYVEKGEVKQFDSIPIGTAFIFEGVIYIKVDPKSVLYGCNVISFDTGIGTFIAFNAKVTVIKEGVIYE